MTAVHADEDVGAFFDDKASAYDASFDEPTPNGHALRVRMAATLRLLEGRHGKVLDVGMGPGRLVVELDRRGWEVSGADLSEEMVAIVRSRLPAARERLVRARLEALPYADASFDAVTATGVLEYADDLPTAMAELARVLRPGGTAVLSMPNPRSPYGLWRRHLVYPAARLVKRRIRAGRQTPPHRTPVRPAGLERLMEASGLRVEAVEPVNLQVALSPLDDLFPAAAVALAERLEAARRAPRRLLATQLVYSARKVG